MSGMLLGQIPTKVFSVDEVLSNYIYVFYAAFGVAFVFTPVMRAVALYYGIIDQPDRVRKMHKVPVAYLGGVAVFLGWLTGLAVSQYLTLHRIDPGWPTIHPKMHFSIVVGALLIVTLGLWDDILGLRPWMKISGQIAAALCLLVDGVGATATQSIIVPVTSRVLGLMHMSVSPTGSLMTSIVGISSAILVVIIVVGCCNASNLMDGLDGLCGGVTAVIAAGFLFVAVHLAMRGGGVNTNWDALRVILGLALLGAVLGFIPYNFNPASIFMGDTGSMFLGFACATMITLMAQERPKWFLASMVMFALPILDTSLAFARRWINGRPVFSPDKQHFHHQLVARGFTVKQTVMISYGLAVFFGLLGVAIVFMRTRYTVAIYLVIFGSIIVAAYKMGMVHEQPLTAPPSTLDDAVAESFTPTVDAGTVMDIREAPHEVSEVDEPVASGSWDSKS